MYTVFLKDLEIYAYHGVSAEEKSLGHRFLLSVDLTVAGTADTTDDVDDTTDYGAVADFLTRDRGRFDTMERCARVLAEGILAEFPLVNSATIFLSKKAPPVPHVLAEAGVRFTLSRAPA